MIEIRCKVCDIALLKYDPELVSPDNQTLLFHFLNKHGEVLDDKHTPEVGK